MIVPVLILAALAALGQAPAIEPEHEANPVFSALLKEGVKLNGAPTTLPAPLLRDGISADEERLALRKIAGSDRAVDDLLRDSVTAPQVVRVHDLASSGPVLVRAADVWFAVHADLAAVDPEKAAHEASKSEPVEAANMRFETRVLQPDQVKGAGQPEPDPRREWYAHLTGRLLDRIGVEVTDQTFFTRSKGSVVVAARTARPFDADARWPNRWWPVTRRGGRAEKGQAQAYAGSASYVKISRLKSRDGMLLVEVHFAFAEPRAWFDGAPILRSKITLVAQDQVRRLRRELAKQKTR